MSEIKIFRNKPSPNPPRQFNVYSLLVENILCDIMKRFSLIYIIYSLYKLGTSIYNLIFHKYMAVYIKKIKVLDIFHVQFIEHL